MIGLSMPTIPVEIIWPRKIVDSRNNDRLDYDSPATVVATQGMLHPSSSSEIFGGQDVNESTELLLLPSGSLINSTCRVRADHSLFEVDGEPRRWRSPTGNLDHLEVSLKRWTPNDQQCDCN